MLIARVVHHEVDDHADATLVRFGEKALEVRIGPVVALDRLVIGRVVSVIARRLKNRHQPDGIDTEVVGGRGVTIVEIAAGRTTMPSRSPKM